MRQVKKDRGTSPRFAASLWQCSSLLMHRLAVGCGRNYSLIRDKQRGIRSHNNCDLLPKSSGRKIRSQSQRGGSAQMVPDEHQQQPSGVPATSMNRQTGGQLPQAINRLLCSTGSFVRSALSSGRCHINIRSGFIRHPGI